MKKLKKIGIYIGGIIGILTLIVLNFFYKTPLTNCMSDQLGESFTLVEQDLIAKEILLNNSNQSYKELYINTFRYDKNFSSYQIENIKNALRLLRIDENIISCSTYKRCIIKRLLFNLDIREITSINRKEDNIQMTGKYPEGTPAIYTYENFEDYLSKQIDAKLFVPLKIKNYLL